LAARLRDRHGADEPKLRVVDVLVTEDDDREMHFTVLVVEPVGYEALGGWLKLPPSPALVIQWYVPSTSRSARTR